MPPPTLEPARALSNRFRVKRLYLSEQGLVWKLKWSSSGYNQLERVKHDMAWLSIDVFAQKGGKLVHLAKKLAVHFFLPHLDIGALRCICESGIFFSLSDFVRNVENSVF